MGTNDRLAPLLERFRVHAHLFHTGALCGVTVFDAQPGRGFLHVLRAGEMAVSHHDIRGRLTRIDVSEPSLLFYPRPLEHAFHNAPIETSDFACASLDVEGCGMHPLFRSLPPVVVLPLAAVPSLGPSLELLFAEVDQDRCGDRLLIDRLFEVVLIQLLRWVFDHSQEIGVSEGLVAGLADESLARALSAVHSNPEYPWSLENLAREARMGRSTFAERFKRIVGLAPGDYVTDWRMLLAQEMLRQGSPVSSVAMQVGYTNAPTFSRAFKRRLGVAPKAWAAA